MRERRYIHTLVALLAGLTLAAVIAQSPAEAAAPRRRILNVYVSLPSKIESVDWYLTMQQRRSNGEWTNVSKVAPCYLNASSTCNESRVEDPGSAIPALPGLRTKSGAYYRFVFGDLAAGTYRFTGNGYYHLDGAGVPFKTQIYRTT